VSDKPVVAISVGDLNGVGIEIALRSHTDISLTCKPIYCIDESMLKSAAELLHVKIPDDFTTLHVGDDFEIRPGVIDKESGLYSYHSFKKAIELCEDKKADAVVTMPIHKEAWAKAGLEYVGHTDLLRKHFNQEAIMMLGCEKMYVALFSEHIALKDVALHVSFENLSRFLMDFKKSVDTKKVAVLALNPHAGDGGVLGDEEKIIIKAIEYANKEAGSDIFRGPVVPDIAFTPHFRKEYRYFIAMYHDQGLAPLKALYFDESINISLNLPIIRTSVDHGTAFDIAYKNQAENLSYLNAVKAAVNLV
jgi:4-hydroxythreonine-4-phosphate dehydrogenase